LVNPLQTLIGKRQAVGLSFKSGNCQLSSRDYASNEPLLASLVSGKLHCPLRTVAVASQQATFAGNCTRMKLRELPVLMSPIKKLSMRTIDVKAKPNSRQSLLSQLADGSWLAQLKSPPVDGKANQELIALVAKHFGIAKSSVAIKTGSSGRLKRVVIDDE
jgi:uncharacterized protein